MAYGYSIRFAELVKKRHRANPDDPLYLMGKLCIENDVMMADVAESLSVSKQALYKWFAGDYAPKPEQLAKINSFNKRLRKQYEKG